MLEVVKNLIKQGISVLYARNNISLDVKGGVDRFVDLLENNFYRYCGYNFFIKNSNLIFDDVNCVVKYNNVIVELVTVGVEFGEDVVISNVLLNASDYIGVVKYSFDNVVWKRFNVGDLDRVRCRRVYFKFLVDKDIDIYGFYVLYNLVV